MQTDFPEKIFFLYPIHGWYNMGEIRISIPSNNLEFPYPVCKIKISETNQMAIWKQYLAFSYEVWMKILC